MYGYALLRVYVFVFVGYYVGVVRRCREHSRHERLAELRHLESVELQEGLVPDGPHAVEVAVAAKALVVVILRAPEVVVEARGARKGLEAHRAVLGPVEESRVVALVLQLAGQSAHVVHRRGREEERLHKHWYAREYARHAVDALAPVAV